MAQDVVQMEEGSKSLMIHYASFGSTEILRGWEEA